MKNKLDHPEIIPECFVDTNLIQTLVHGTVNHQHGCNNVIGSLNNTFKDRFAIGIIDLDRVQHRKNNFFSQCSMIAETSHLTLFKHNSRSQYLITINPAIDKFILDNAAENKISLEKYDLPTDFKNFLSESKQNTSNLDSRFTKLFWGMKDVPEMRSLQATLQYLIKNKYKATAETAKRYFVGELDSH